jgi:hypothetical protein
MFPVLDSAVHHVLDSAVHYVLNRSTQDPAAEGWIQMVQPSYLPSPNISLARPQKEVEAFLAAPGRTHRRVLELEVASGCSFQYHQKKRLASMRSHAEELSVEPVEGQMVKEALTEIADVPSS